VRRFGGGRFLAGGEGAFVREEGGGAGGWGEGVIGGCG